MIRVTTLLAIVLTVSVRISQADVIEVGGAQYGSLTFVQRHTFSSLGEAAQVRFALPTIPLYNHVGSLFIPTGLVVEALDVTNAPLPINLIWYNHNGPDYFRVNSGAWVQVASHAAGLPLGQFTIRIAVEGWSDVQFYGVSGDVGVYGPSTVSYTAPTATSDFEHPLVAAEFASALVDSRWSTGTLLGVRGQLEKLSLAVSDLVYNSHTNYGAGRTASAALASGSGDCDDFTKVLVAFYRRAGVPSRCVLTGTVPAAHLGIGNASEANLHATGQYWTGSGTWESLEAGFTENFMPAGQIILGIAADMEELRPFPDFIGSGPTFEYISSTYSGSMGPGAYGGWAERGRRYIGTSRLVAHQTVVSYQQPWSMGIPWDQVQPSEGGGEGGGEGEIMPARLRVLATKKGDQIILSVNATSGGETVAEVFDLAGRLLARSRPITLPSGVSELRLQVSGDARGVGFVRARCGQAEATTKVLLGP